MVCSLMLYTSFSQRWILSELCVKKLFKPGGSFSAMKAWLPPCMCSWPIILSLLKTPGPETVEWLALELCIEQQDKLLYLFQELPQETMFSLPTWSVWESGHGHFLIRTSRAPSLSPVHCHIVHAQPQNH